MHQPQSAFSTSRTSSTAQLSGRVLAFPRLIGSHTGDLAPGSAFSVERDAAAAARREDREKLLAWQTKKVRAYIEADLHERLFLGVAAEHARLSPSYFSKCFRRSFGVSFPRFVAQKRIERAQGLMMQSAAKLCHIALACGFADQAHFTRTFASIIGCPPARWRRQALEAPASAGFAMSALA